MTTLWFYLTPIFWPYDALAGNGLSWVYTIIQFNPMYHFVTCFRQMVTGIPLPSDIGVAAELGRAPHSQSLRLRWVSSPLKKLENKFIL